MSDEPASESSATVTCHTLVARRREGGFDVLVPIEVGRPTLPRFEIAASVPWFDVAVVNRAVHRRYGLRVTVLRCLAGDTNTHPSDERVYSMEAHDADRAPPPGTRWLASDALDAMPFARSEHGALVGVWLRTASRAVPASRHPPWTRAGWLSRVERFVAGALEAHGIERTGPPVQLRTWQRSCVLRVPTEEGGTVLKASPAMFGHEPGVTALLAERYPASFPEVLAFDSSEGWTLMRELRGRPLSDIAEPARWEEALRRFARLQIESVDALDELVHHGCPSWPLERLAERLGALLDDTNAMLIGTEHGLDDREARTLQALGQSIVSSLERLSESPLPLALDHGDLRSVHIIAGTHGGYRFFDLSDCAVSHPFFSAVGLIDFEDVPGAGESTRAVRERLRDAYLEGWAGYASADRLARLFELARVGAIVRALVYRYDVLLPKLEPTERWEFMVPYWQRKLLQAIRNGEGR